MVMLAASMRSLSVKGQNLVVLGPPVAEDEAEEQILLNSAEAVDALGRVLERVPPDASLAVMARHLLEKATEQWAVRQWELLLADGSRADCLEEGCLVLSQSVAPGKAAAKSVRAFFGTLAEEVASIRSPAEPIRSRAEAVSRVLFGQYGFIGVAQDHPDPQQTLLHHVVEQPRTGTPTTLAIIWMAIARRVQVPCHLCAHCILPGASGTTTVPHHALVRVATGGRGLADDLFVDASNGRTMTYGELLGFLAVDHVSEEMVAWRPAAEVYVFVLRNFALLYRPGRGGFRDDVASLQRFVGAASQCIAVCNASSLVGEPAMSTWRDYARRRIETELMRRPDAAQQLALGMG